MKIAAVVILYHPNINTLIKINTYYQKVSKVYVFDNTESSHSCISTALSALPKVKYFHDKENKGIAKRLNNAVELAIKDGFDWLLMMDQDSCFEIGMVDLYLASINEYNTKENVALFGINFNNPAPIQAKTCVNINSDLLITSGSILNLSLIEKIGLFDENLFIDGVDHEYCVRSILKGFKVISFPHILLTHQLGLSVKRTSIKTLFLIKKNKKLHTPLRCYYVYRNNLYLQHKYKKNNPAIMKKLDSIAKAIILTSLFYGRNSLKLARYLWLARLDFGNKKMDKFSH